MARYLTNEDYHAYGPELLDVMRRGAREAVQGDLEDVKRRQWELMQREQRMQNQMVFRALDAAMPDWRTTNNDENFKLWLSQQEELSGRRAHDLLLDAFHSADVPRILRFFRDWLAVSGQAPAAQAQTPSVGRTPPRQPAGATSVADATRALTKLYDDSRKGRYNGREAELAAEERRLHAIIHGKR